MSSALLRRNSSKQGLQNLLRVTAQRSVEDAEEAEREQRKRARPRPATPPEDLYAGELKADQPSPLEEDEGFSDGGARSRQTGRDAGEELLPKEASWVSSQPRLRRQERQEEEEKEEQQEAPHARIRMERGGEALRERAGREEVSPAPDSEEGRRRMEEEEERRRTREAGDTMKSLSCSPTQEDRPRTPSAKTDIGESPDAGTSHLLSERTVSLGRSLKTSNSFKKTPPPVLMSRLDDRLEQYANAIESSQQEVKAARPLQVVTPTSDPVASRRCVFQAGDAQSPTRAAPCKDTEGLKVGVANLITQWVKGSPDSCGKAPPSRPSEVKPGDVMQKKNIWEGIGDVGRSTSGGDTSGKKFKFVVTGHGKYEKL